jgi:hypothetical protein
VLFFRWESNEWAECHHIRRTPFRSTPFATRNPSGVTMRRSSIGTKHRPALSSEGRRRSRMASVMSTGAGSRTARSRPPTTVWIGMSRMGMGTMLPLCGNPPSQDSERRIHIVNSRTRWKSWQECYARKAYERGTWCSFTVRSSSR